MAPTQNMNSYKLTNKCLILSLPEAGMLDANVDVFVFFLIDCLFNCGLGERKVFFSS